MTHTATTPIMPDLTNGMDFVHYDITSSLSKGTMLGPIGEIPL
jgi:hypothetical protein